MLCGFDIIVEKIGNMKKRLRILFLTPRLPYPIIGGDRIKSYHMLQHLAKSHDVTLVSFYQGANMPKSYAKEIEKYNIKTHIIPLNPIKAGFNTAIRLAGKNPLEIDYYTQPEFRKVVESLDPEKNFDLGIAFFMRTAEYIKDMNIKKILMSEDCRTTYQKRSYEGSQNLKQRMIRLWEVKKLRKYEPAIVNKFDITTLVSNEDIRDMQKLNPGAEYRLLTNGTDINRLVPPPPSMERKHLIFTGKLDVWANELMVQSIVYDILPLIREKVPDTELNIVGARPPQSMLSMQNKFIHVHGNVPDMLPYLQSAAIFVHPHQGAAGIQNKILEAMACGVPVVTTVTGNQGINAIHEESALIGHTKEELARHAIRILTDKELAQKISVNSRKLIEDTHSWELAYKQIDSIIDELFE